MKKTMMTLVLALVAMLPIQAQSLEGKWIDVAETGEEDVNLSYILTFEGDQVRQYAICGSVVEKVGDVSIYITVPAQEYVPGSNTLNFTFNASQVDIGIQDIEYSEQMKEIIKNAPDREKALKLVIRAGFVEQKHEMAKQILLNGMFTITKITDNSFEMKDADGETYAFARYTE
jgi:hypothetical protein